MDDKKFGLKDGDIDCIIKVLATFAELDKAVFFGSRATGKFKQGSDIDIALFTNDKSIASHIAFLLNEESLLPYKFDIIDYNTLTHPEFREHINSNGILFFEHEK